jgi:hypothetical protein
MTPPAVLVHHDAGLLAKAVAARLVSAIPGAEPPDPAIEGSGRRPGFRFESASSARRSKAQ